MLQPTILWGPPAELSLSSDDIQVWCAIIDQPLSRIQQLAKLLAADEIARAESFYFEQHRNRFIVARGLLRKILGYYLDIEPSLVQFCYGHRGKPALATTSGAGTLQFNVSHSQGLALYAVTLTRPVGIDVEYIRPMPDAEQIASRFFAASENATLRALPASQKEQAFFNCWTRKESYIKACGDGLAIPLDEFEVSLTPGEPARILSIEGSPELAARWSLIELTPASDYAAALAVVGDGFCINCWQWSSSDL